MQLQSSLFSRGVLLGLHDFSIQSTVVFLIINFLTSYFCKRLSFFICKFCQQALLVYPRLFMRSFRFSPPRGRRSFSSHARKNLCRRLPKCSAEEQLFRQLFWPQPHARGGRQMRKKCGFSEVGVLPFASHAFPHGECLLSFFVIDTRIRKWRGRLCFTLF